MAARSYVPRPIDDESRQQPVVLLGDALRPAEDTFRPLHRILAGQVRLLTKDLEAVREEPAPDYSLDHEVEALVSAAREQGWERFQLVASGEGASAALVTALRHPMRVLSLALDHPVWAGNREPTGEETGFWQQVTNAMRLEDTPLVEEYIRLQYRKQALPNPDEADLQPEPSTAPPRTSREFAGLRPQALRAMWQAYGTTDLDYAELVRLETECYIAIGSDSHPAYEALASRLRGLLRDVHVEVYEGRSRMDPPVGAEAERFALALSQLWRRSMREAVAAGAPTMSGEEPPHFA